jgi:hypothetical protein
VLTGAARCAGGYRLISPVRTQGMCGGCVSFTTIACAEAAVASALKASTLNTLDFSEQKLFFCGGLVRGHPPRQQQRPRAGCGLNCCGRACCRLAGDVPALGHCLLMLMLVPRCADGQLC